MRTSVGTGAFRRRVVFFAAFILTASVLAANLAQGATVVGSLPGSFGVSATGAATYSIPIALPRGSGGLTPSIALVYNSQSGSGAAGYGWTLSGLSAITRCNKTIHDDGSTEAVTLTASDDYCLDGQRLIFSSSNSTYDTEIESFSRITATSGTNGPGSFTVQTKDGETWEYGNTTDSKILATGTSTVRVWALDKVTDTNGNYYTITYQNNDTTTGDYWPLHIDYTGNTGAGTSPVHEIQFNWTPRSAASVQARYLAGTLITQTQLLSDIKIIYNGSTTFTYSLAYQTDSATQRNQLHTVTECAADGSCFEPTSISWQSGAAGWQTPVSVAGISVDAQHAQAAHLVDVNGDGIADLLYPGTTDWLILFGQSGGGFGVSPEPIDTGVPVGNYQWALVTDTNGDGKADLLVPGTNSWTLWESTGNSSGTIFNTIPSGLGSYGTETNSQTGLPAYEGNVAMADIQGRGLQDLIYSDGVNIYKVTNNNPASVSASNPQFGTRTSVGTTGILNDGSLQHYHEYIDEPMDFDGSGRFGRLGLNITTFASTCNPQDQPGCVPNSTTKYTWTGLVSTDAGFVNDEALTCWAQSTVPIPFNAINSGATDLLYSCASDGLYDAEISTGTAFLQVPTNIAHVSDYDPVLADYYGDGRQEAIVPDANASTGWSMIRVNYDLSVSGYKSSVTSSVAAPYPSDYLQGSLRIGPIEANGLDDLVYAVQSGSAYAWHYALHSGGVPDLVASITDGLGNTWQPSFTSLAQNDATYTLVPSAIYPAEDVKIPLQVVSNYQASDGIGGAYTVKYTYTDAKYSNDGLGFLGFASRTVVDGRNSVSTTDTYDQTWPFIGDVDKESVTQSNGGSLSETDNSYASDPVSCAGGALCFVFLSKQTVTSYDANGNPLKTVETAADSEGTPITITSFDNYGDLGTSTTITTDDTTGNPDSGQSFSTTTVTHYAHDTTGGDYCIDLPIFVQITKNNSRGSIVRSKSSPQDGNICRSGSVTVKQVSSTDPAITITTTPVTTSYSYDSWGNISSSTTSASDISTRTTTADYTTYQGEYPDWVENALNQKTTLTWYPALGLKHAVTDPNGQTTSFDYDAFGRMTGEESPDGVTTGWVYNSCTGSCIVNGVYSVSQSITSSGGAQSISTGSTVYDAEGRVIKVNKPLLGGVLTHVDTDYNQLGQVAAVSTPFLSGASKIYWTQTTYDVLGRPTKITKPANDKTTDYTDSGANPSPPQDTPLTDISIISYNGFTASTTLSAPGDVASETSTRTFNAIGEVVGVTDSNNTATSYDYDAFGDLVGTTIGAQTTSMTYDGLGHKLSMTDPDMGHWTYTPDALGELVQQVDAKGQTITQHYDLLGRIKTRTELDASGIQTVADTWTYDTATNGIGLPASVSDSNGFSKQYGYDSLSRPDDLTTTIGGSSYDISSSYDNFGRVQTITYPESVTPVTSSTSPTAALTVTPNPAVIVLGASVALDASASTDPNSLPLQYGWSQSSGPGATTFSNTGPGADTTNASFSLPGNYTLQLVVRDAQADSAPASVAVAVKPPAPGGVSVAHDPAYTGKVLVTWTPMTVAASYDVYQSTDNVNFTYLGSTQGSANTSYPVTGLQDGNYYYRVVAIGGGVSSAPSGSASIDVEIPPGVPGSLSAPSSVSAETPPASYNVSWGAPASTGGATPVYTLEEENTLATSPTFTPIYTDVSGTSYPISHDQDGIYVYRVKACNPADTVNLCSDYVTTTGTAVTNPPTVPGTPGVLSTDQHTTSWPVSWDGSTVNSGSVTPQITYYLNERLNGGSWHQVYSGSGISTTLAGHTSNGTYTYEVKACTTDSSTDGTACSDESAVSAGYATIIRPPVPTSISVPANSNWNGSFTVSWNENAGGITVTSYKVDIGDHDTETGTTNWVDGHCTSSTTSCTFSANQVSAGTYLVRVDACDSSICSAEVQAGSAVTVSYLSPPAAPSLTGPANTTGSISLNWSKPSTTTSFELYGAYQSRSTGVWTTASVIYSGSAQSYTDTIGVAKSHARYYVRACNQGGCGSDSNTITVAYNVLGGGGGGGGGSRQVTTQSTEAAPATDTSDSSTPAPSSSTPPAAGPGGLTVVEHQPVDLLPQIDPVPGYRITTFTLPPALPVPLFASNLGTDHDTLEALRRARLQRVGHVLNQASEQAMQAAANRRAEARFAMLAPSVSTVERAAWLKSQQAQLRANPDGPRYAPPAYIAYADAHVVPATGTPYRFTVQYVYDDASGGLAAVANADTGFIYWQADMDSGVAPVDAFGHLLAYTDGNLVSTVSSFDAATGAPTGISAGIGQAQDVQQLLYTWDGYGNLQQRCDANAKLDENFTNDGLNRLTQSTVDSGTSVTTAPCSGGTQVTALSLSYDTLGNITCKSDVVGHACAPGSTDYTYDPDHPHAVQSIAGLPGTYTYDADGNMLTGNNRTLTWSVDNLPTDIQGAGGSSSFAYGPDHQRYLQTQANGTDTTYIDGLYEIISTNGGATRQYRHNILADGQVIAVHTLDQSGNVSTSYLHYDHLGSVDAITDDTGAVAERMSFDAFGQRRDPSNWTDDLTSGDIASLKDNTDRGYTDQEQLDNVGLIHMNGRVYDPQIGRFISADPVMGGDRYAYVGNNPLARTDPSGYCWAGCFWQPSAPSNFLKNQSNVTDLLLTGLPSANWAAVNHIHWETQNNQTVQLAVAIVAAYYTGGLASSSWGTGFWGSVGTGAVAGGTASGSIAALNSETPGQVLDATGRGAAVGAVGGGLLYGANDITAYSGNNFGVGFVSHGVAGGLTSEAAGGSFNQGFKLGAFAYSAYWAYQQSVGAGPSWDSGQGTTPKSSDFPPWDENQDVNNFGAAVPAGYPICGLCEGSAFSDTMDAYPGMNALATLHDVWADDFTINVFSSDPSLYYWTLDVPTMPLAAAVTYGGLINTSIGYGIMAGREESGGGP